MAQGHGEKGTGKDEHPAACVSGGFCLRVPLCRSGHGSAIMSHLLSPHRFPVKSSKIKAAGSTQVKNWRRRTTRTKELFSSFFPASSVVSVTAPLQEHGLFQFGTRRFGTSRVTSACKSVHRQEHGSVKHRMQARQTSN